jgi:hypothetical protein
MTLVLTIMGIFVMGSRAFSEGLAALWSGLLLCALSVGGTMIMRKFHSSFAVGLFMGCVVAMSQLFFMLFLMYVVFCMVWLLFVVLGLCIRVLVW